MITNKPILSQTTQQIISHELSLTIVDQDTITILTSIPILSPHLYTTLLIILITTIRPTHTLPKRNKKLIISILNTPIKHFQKNIFLTRHTQTFLLPSFPFFCQEIQRPSFHHSDQNVDLFSRLKQDTVTEKHTITNIHSIIVPPKIWRPQVKSEYIPPTYSDVDESLFLNADFGKAIIIQECPDWNPGSRTDIRIWNATTDQEEFDKNLKIHNDTNPKLQLLIKNLIKKHWDCFYKEGIKQTILGHEFCIDTGNHTPVACRKPKYGPLESTVIQSQVETLVANKQILLCNDSPWLSTIVLAAKPHQEHVTNIKDFIWRMCVSYRALNKITKPFLFPIPRCEDAIENFGANATQLFFIIMDALQGYHQIKVRQEDQQKLAFYAPDGQIYTYQVMPFGPRNFPSVYTCIMSKLKKTDNFFSTNLS